MALTSLMVAMALEPVLPSVLAYAGPDQILPLASILGAIIGFLLIVWQRVVAVVYRAWKFTMRKVRGTAE
jgi:hypothetical protein